MRICPKCEEENPSSANHCMFCGALLIEEEQLPVEVVLRKELDEANETIELLKKSLAAIQEMSETDNVAEIQMLNDQIENCNGTINALSDRVESQNHTISELNSQLEEEKKKKGGRWGIIFVLLFIISSILALVNYNDRENYQSLYYDYESRYRRLETENADLRKEKESGSSELSALKTKYNELENKHKELANQYPLIIDNIMIGNVYRGGAVETDYGNTLYSSHMMFFSPKLVYRGYADGTKTLKVKWFKPDGSLSYSASSPSGFSQSTDCYIYQGSQTVVLGSWGNDNMGFWPSGSYRIEVWYGNLMLKSKTFTVY